LRPSSCSGDRREAGSRHPRRCETSAHEQALDLVFERTPGPGREQGLIDHSVAIVRRGARIGSCSTSHGGRRGYFAFVSPHAYGLGRPFESDASDAAVPGVSDRPIDSPGLRRSRTCGSGPTRLDDKTRQDVVRARGTGGRPVVGVGISAGQTCCSKLAHAIRVFAKLVTGIGAPHEASFSQAFHPSYLERHDKTDYGEAGSIRRWSVAYSRVVFSERRCWELREQTFASRAAAAL